MPVVHMARVTVAVPDEEMRTIGITPALESELLIVSVLLGCEQTMGNSPNPLPSPPSSHVSEQFIAHLVLR
jgi:hypothetical protein